MNRHIIRYYAEDAVTGEMLDKTEGVISDRGLDSVITFIRAFRAIVPDASLKESVDFKDAFLEVFNIFAKDNRMATIEQIRSGLFLLNDEKLFAVAEIVRRTQDELTQRVARLNSQLD